jgi:hypothetical protein
MSPKLSHSFSLIYLNVIYNYYQLQLSLCPVAMLHKQYVNSNREVVQNTA